MLNTPLTALLALVLYPAWLLAGGADYVCHRMTRIEDTSGPIESLLHLAQFFVLLIAMFIYVAFEVTRVTFAIIALAVLLHSVLAFMDTTFTDGRRRIAPFEQWIHGLLDCIPWFAVCLIGLLSWDRLLSGAPAMTGDVDISRAEGWLLSSFLVLTGIPIVEELARALRGAAGKTRPTSRGSRRFGHHEIEDPDQCTEGHHAKRHPESQVSPVLRR
jgi:hypothetical protein